MRDNRLNTNSTIGEISKELGDENENGILSLLTKNLNVMQINMLINGQYTQLDTIH